MQDGNFKPIPLERRSAPEQEEELLKALEAAATESYLRQLSKQQTPTPAQTPAKPTQASRPLTNADDALAIVRKITAPDVPDSRKYEAIRLVATFDRQAPVSKAQMWRVIRWLLDRCSRPGAGPQLYDAMRAAQGK